MSAILESLPAAIAQEKQRPPRKGPSDLIIDTQMRDRALIERSLKAAGIKFRFIEGVLYAEPVDESLLFGFLPNETGAWAAHFHHKTQVDVAQGYVEKVTYAYRQVVQQDTYERVLDRAGAEGMQFQSEYVDDENAIVLVFEVE